MVSHTQPAAGGGTAWLRQRGGSAVAPPPAAKPSPEDKLAWVQAINEALKASIEAMRVKGGEQLIAIVAEVDDLAKWLDHCELTTDDSDKTLQYAERIAARFGRFADNAARAFEAHEIAASQDRVAQFLDRRDAAAAWYGRLPPERQRKGVLDSLARPTAAKASWPRVFSALTAIVGVEQTCGPVPPD